MRGGGSDGGEGGRGGGPTPEPPSCPPKKAGTHARTAARADNVRQVIGKVVQQPLPRQPRALRPLEPLALVAAQRHAHLREGGGGGEGRANEGGEDGGVARRHGNSSGV